MELFDSSSLNLNLFRLFMRSSLARALFEQGHFGDALDPFSAPWPTLRRTVGFSALRWQVWEFPRQELGRRWEVQPLQDLTLTHG
jgi:hypothetical protein